MNNLNKIQYFDKFALQDTLKKKIIWKEE